MSDYEEDPMHPEDEATLAAEVEAMGYGPDTPWRDFDPDEKRHLQDLAGELRWNRERPERERIYREVRARQAAGQDDDPWVPTGPEPF